MNKLHSFAVPRDDTHASAPSDVLNAMGDTSFDVYSMQQCNPWQASSGLCDFSPAFAAEAASAKSALGGNFFKNQAKSNIKNAAAAAVALSHRSASGKLRGTPWPLAYMAPRLNCACAFPWSAALRYHSTAKASL